MQNNATELTQKLLRSLDSNYNVLDMPTVVEVISLLEKVVITKEVLETTRLGKHVNELRRKTSDESLSKRAKELVKKWRNMVLPDSNGQIKAHTDEETKPKKRPIKEQPSDPVKRLKLNGSNELDLSDNSNSSFKEAKEKVIFINSDSNSSLPNDPLVDQQLPKKRGRKKGSKNHRNLLEEAESSFSKKLDISRGNSKVKTTQELVASLQNKSIGLVAAKSKEDLSERAAKLTERVSIIDQKLNTNARKNSLKKAKVSLSLDKSESKVIESGSVINDKSLEDEVIVVDEPEVKEEKEEEVEEQRIVEKLETDLKEAGVRSLSVEEALKQLPPIDPAVLEEEEEPRCLCLLREEHPEDELPRFEFLEEEECPAKHFLKDRYGLDHVSEDRVKALHENLIPNLNGNLTLSRELREPETTTEGLFVNVVPNMSGEFVDKGERTEFSEWHECVETPSYNGEILKILPYVIID